MVRFLIGATFLCSLVSCSQSIPYTLEIQEKSHLSVGDLQRLQFYLSDQVVLYRATAKNQANVVNGKLYTSPHREPDRIVFKAGTPGKAVLTSSNRLGVCFEDNAENFLVFGTNRQGGVYYLQAKEWENGHGLLKYGGDEWFVAPGGGKVYLMIELKTIKHPYQVTKVANGRIK